MGRGGLRYVTTVWLILFALAGCGRPQAGNRIVVSVIPTQASDAFTDQMKRLGERLSAESGLDVQVQIGSDYAAVVEGIRFQKVDVAFFGPFTYVVAHAQSGARAFITQNINGKPYYHSYMIVKTDSPIGNIKSNADLQALTGKVFAFGDPASTSSSLIPRLALKRAGVDPERDIQPHFTGSHDAVLLAVANGQADIGALDSAIFAGSLSQKLPDAFAAVRVVWVSEPLYQYPWAHRSDLDAAVVKKLQDAFRKITEPDILSAFGADGFVVTDDAQYESVRQAATAFGIDLRAYSLQKK